MMEACAKNLFEELPLCSRETEGRNICAHYFDCGDDFMTYTHQHLLNHTKIFQLVVCQLHLNRAVTLKNVQYRFAKSLQLCPSLCDPMDCSPPGCSVHGDSPGKYTGVGCHFPLQGIFPTQGSNCGLLHCRGVLYCLSHLQAHYRFRSYFHSCPILIHLAASGTRKGPLGGGEFFGSSVVRAELAILTVFFSQNWYVYDMIIKPRNAWMKFFFLFYEAESDSSSKTVLD